jgi:hypothetical protein
MRINVLLLLLMALSTHAEETRRSACEIDYQAIFEDNLESDTGVSMENTLSSVLTCDENYCEQREIQIARFYGFPNVSEHDLYQPWGSASNFMDWFAYSHYVLHGMSGIAWAYEFFLFLIIAFTDYWDDTVKWPKVLRGVLHLAAGVTGFLFMLFFKSASIAIFHTTNTALLAFVQRSIYEMAIGTLKMSDGLVARNTPMMSGIRGMLVMVNLVIMGLLIWHGTRGLPGLTQTYNAIAGLLFLIGAWMPDLVARIAEVTDPSDSSAASSNPIQNDDDFNVNQSVRKLRATGYVIRAAFIIGASTFLILLPDTAVIYEYFFRCERLDTAYWLLILSLTFALAEIVAIVLLYYYSAEKTRRQQQQQQQAPFGNSGPSALRSGRSKKKGNKTNYSNVDLAQIQVQKPLLPQQDSAAYTPAWKLTQAPYLVVPTPTQPPTAWTGPVPSPDSQQPQQAASKSINLIEEPGSEAAPPAYDAANAITEGKGKRKFKVRRN